MSGVRAADLIGSALSQWSEPMSDARAYRLIHTRTMEILRCAQNDRHCKEA